MGPILDAVMAGTRSTTLNEALVDRHVSLCDRRRGQSWQATDAAASQPATHSTEGGADASDRNGGGSALVSAESSLMSAASHSGAAIGEQVFNSPQTYRLGPEPIHRADRINLAFSA